MESSLRRNAVAHGLARAASALVLVALAGCDRDERRPATDTVGARSAHLSVDYPSEFRSGDTTLHGPTIARGDSLYQGVIGQANCIICHGPFLTGGSHGTNLRDTTWHHGDGSYGSIMSVIITGVEEPIHSPIPRMPPMGGFALTEEEIRALAAYVQWFSSTRAAADRAAGEAGAHEHGGHSG